MATNRGNVRKKKYPKVEQGRIYIKALQNNTIVSLTRCNGDTLMQKSPATLGFKGSQKSTPYASQQVLAKMGDIACKEFGMKRADIFISGSGIASDMIKFLLNDNKDLVILSITYNTSTPHNGCRPPREARN